MPRTAFRMNKSDSQVRLNMTSDKQSFWINEEIIRFKFKKKSALHPCNARSEKRKIKVWINESQIAGPLKQIGDYVQNICGLKIYSREAVFIKYGKT